MPRRFLPPRLTGRTTQVSKIDRLLVFTRRNFSQLVNFATAVGEELMHAQNAAIDARDNNGVTEVGLLDSDHRRQLLALRELRMDVLDDAEELLLAQFDAGLIRVYNGHVAPTRTRWYGYTTVLSPAARL